MDLDRYRSMYFSHHAFISQSGKDPEVKLVKKFNGRWTCPYKFIYTIKDMLGLHAYETNFQIKEAEHDYFNYPGYTYTMVAEDGKAIRISMKC